MTLLLQELADCSVQPNFGSIVCRALEASGLASELFCSFVKTKVPFTQQITIALGLASAVDKKTKEEGAKFLKAKLADLNEFNSNEKLSVDVLHQVVFFVRDCASIQAKQKQVYVNALQSLYAEEFGSALMSPLLFDTDTRNGVDSKLSYSGSTEDVTPLLSSLSATVKPCDILQDLGFQSMEKSASLKEVLSQFPNATAPDIADIIAMMIRTHSSSNMIDEKALPLTNVLSMAITLPPTASKGVPNSPTWQAYLQASKNETDSKDEAKGSEGIKKWRIDIFVQVVKDLFPRLDWTEVYQSLDRPQFLVDSSEGFVLFLEVYNLATKNRPFPVSILFSRWENHVGQLSLIKQALQAPPSIFSFTGTRRHRGVKSVEFEPDNMDAWGSLELLETLLDLSETELYIDVRDLFLIAKEQVPELLLCGLVQVREAENNAPTTNMVLIGRNPLHEEALSALMPVYLRQHNSPMLQRLWNLNSKIVVRWMVKLYLENRDFLSRILDFALELKEALTVILEARPFYFAIDLATMASNREILNLEKWLTLRIVEHGASFIEASFDYIHKNYHTTQMDVGKRPMSGETVAVYYKCLFENKPSMSSENLFVLQHLFNQSCHVSPQLSSLITSSADDIEAEAHNYFTKMYNQQITLPQVVDLLQRCMRSQQNQQRELYACMIHNLFDEYKKLVLYPIKELRITGLLFGMLIQHEVLIQEVLGMALRYVLEALKHDDTTPEDTKMFRFGMWALGQFKNRLCQWPQYCALILEIPLLQGNHIELVAFLENILAQSQLGRQGNLANDLAALKIDNPPPSQVDMQPPQQPPQMQESNSQQPHFEDKSNLLQHNPEHVEMSRQLVHQVVNQVVQDEFKQTLAPMSQPEKPTAAEAKPTNLSRAKTSPDQLNEIKKQERKREATLPPGGSFGSALNIDTLLSVEKNSPLPLAPSESVKDKMKFIVNNISKTNLPAKAVEFKATLTPEFYPFFSRYLVVERVSRENNFQSLYSEFIDVIKIPNLTKVLIETTYEYIRVVLSTNKILTSSNERSVLKNLGSWLGLLTISKNKPLRAKNLSLKELIIEAYEQGRSIAVIPFVAKVLEACAKSSVFKAPNPWLMALVGLLREIFDLPDLKLNLKFEIEVLFNNLQIKMQDVKPTELLKDRVVRAVDGNFRTEGKAQVGASPMMRPASADILGQEPPDLSQQSLRAAVPPGPSSNQFPPVINPEAITDPQGAQTPTPTGQFPSESTIIPNLPAYVTIHPSIVLFNMYPHLKSCVTTAIDRAIREIIQPVVERSVTIAVVTTRELVIKDFALEPDENKMRKCAHQMVQTLTSSLALVTCKEPLRVSINNHLGSLLEANSNASERGLVEHACIQISSDNLELGCTLIEKAASDRAIREIDEALGATFQIRRKHRQQTGQPYQDVSVLLGGRFPANLPEPLRPKPGGLSTNQLRVYEEFANIPTHHYVPQDASGRTKDTSSPPSGVSGDVSGAGATTAAAAASVVVTPTDNIPSGGGDNSPPTAGQDLNQPAGRNEADATGAGPQTPLTSQQTLDKLITCLAQLEQAVSRFPNHKNTTLASLPSVGARNDHEINILLRMIPVILNQCPRDEAAFPREVVAFTFAHKVFKRLYERDYRHSLLQIDAHIQILKYIWGICPKIVKELTSWLLYSEDERKFMIQITVGLLKARLLHLPDVDLYLAKLVHNVNASGQALQTRNATGKLPYNNAEFFHPHLEFIVNLVRRAIIKEPIMSTSELPHLFDSLQKIMTVAQQRRTKLVVEVLGHLLESVRTAPTAATAPPVATPQPAAATPVSTSPPGPQPTAAPVQTQQDVQQALAQQVQEVREREQRQEVKVLDATANQLLLEEVAMDREQWDEEPAAFRQQIVYLLEDWMNICLQGTASDKIYATYLNLLQQQRVLATPESTSRFFLIITQLCIDSAYASANQPTANRVDPKTGVSTGPTQQFGATSQPTSQLSYTAIDALAKLVVFLVKFFAGGESANNPTNGNAPKIRMLNAFLRSACRVLRRDYDKTVRASQTTFNQRPYFRLFANLLHHLNTPDPSLDSNNVDVLMAFGVFFHLLRPSRVPSFCFSWLELISHRMFMSKLLISKAQQCASLFEHLLVDLFEFMQPYLRNAELTESVKQLYKGALRVLLVLLHDFPEFLCEFHFSFCDVIPITCIQMRNLILSAFPRNMRLPDPFTPNLKVDLLPDITQPPRILSDLTAQLTRHTNLMMQLESYLTKRSPASFLPTIRPALMLVTSSKKTGTKYNIPLINSLVLYVGCQGIAKLQNKSGMVNQFQDNSCMDVFEVLVTSLDAEGRYYVLNAIANQLRYPNNHTHYFSCVLLYLFLQAKQSVIKEQITRVLLERLIVHRPHPWGLLITFIELIKNPRYKFWEQPFTRCAPEIEKLFETVARSCMPTRPAATSGGGPPSGPHPGMNPPTHPGQHPPHPGPHQHYENKPPTNIVHGTHPTPQHPGHNIHPGAPPHSTHGPLGGPTGPNGAHVTQHQHPGPHPVPHGGHSHSQQHPHGPPQHPHNHGVPHPGSHIMPDQRPPMHPSHHHAHHPLGHHPGHAHHHNPHADPQN